MAFERFLSEGLPLYEASQKSDPWFFAEKQGRRNGYYCQAFDESINQLMTPLDWVFDPRLSDQQACIIFKILIEGHNYDI